MKYNLEVNKETALVIAEALEIYSRLKCGQLKHIDDIFVRREFNRQELDDIMANAKSILFPELSQNSYYGIYGKSTPIESKIAYDVYKKIQHEFNKNSKHWNVHSCPHELLASNLPINFTKRGDKK